MDYDPINWYQRPRSTLGEVRCAPVDPSLPPPWREVFDVATGRFYYWNTETNVTQFDKPAYQNPFQSFYPFPYPEPVTSIPPSSALFAPPPHPTHFSPPSLPTSHQTQPLTLPVPVVHDLLNQIAAIQQTIAECSNTSEEALRQFQEHRRRFQELRSQWPCRTTSAAVTSSSCSVHSIPQPYPTEDYQGIKIPVTHPYPNPQHQSNKPPVHPSQFNAGESIVSASLSSYTAPVTSQFTLPSRTKALKIIWAKRTLKPRLHMKMKRKSLPPAARRRQTWVRGESQLKWCDLPLTTLAAADELDVLAETSSASFPVPVDSLVTATSDFQVPAIEDEPHFVESMQLLGSDDLDSAKVMLSNSDGSYHHSHLRNPPHFHTAVETNIALEVRSVSPAIGSNMVVGAKLVDPRADNKHWSTIAGSVSDADDPCSGSTIVQQVTLNDEVAEQAIDLDDFATGYKFDNMLVPSEMVLENLWANVHVAFSNEQTAEELDSIFRDGLELTKAMVVCSAATQSAARLWQWLVRCFNLCHCEAEKPTICLGEAFNKMGELCQHSLSQVSTTVHLNFQDIGGVLENITFAMLKLYQNCLNDEVGNVEWPPDELVEKVSQDVNQLAAEWFNDTISGFGIVATLPACVHDKFLCLPITFSLEKMSLFLVIMRKSRSIHAWNPIVQLWGITNLARRRMHKIRFLFDNERLFDGDYRYKPAIHQHTVSMACLPKKFFTELSVVMGYPFQQSLILPIIAKAVTADFRSELGCMLTIQSLLNICVDETYASDELLNKGDLFYQVIVEIAFSVILDGVVLLTAVFSVQCLLHVCSGTETYVRSLFQREISKLRSILVAKDVALQELDILLVAHVIIYVCPNNIYEYIHTSCRTDMVVEFHKTFMNEDANWHHVDAWAPWYSGLTAKWFSHSSVASPVPLPLSILEFSTHAIGTDLRYFSGDPIILMPTVAIQPVVHPSFDAWLLMIHDKCSSSWNTSVSLLRNFALGTTSHFFKCLSLILDSLHVLFVYVSNHKKAAVNIIFLVAIVSVSCGLFLHTELVENSMPPLLMEFPHHYIPTKEMAMFGIWLPTPTLHVKVWVLNLHGLVVIKAQTLIDDAFLLTELIFGNEFPIILSGALAIGLVCHFGETLQITNSYLHRELYNMSWLPTHVILQGTTDTWAYFRVSFDCALAMVWQNANEGFHRFYSTLWYLMLFNSDTPPVMALVWSKYERLVYCSEWNLLIMDSGAPKQSDADTLLVRNVQGSVSTWRCSEHEEETERMMSVPPVECIVDGHIVLPFLYKLLVDITCPRPLLFHVSTNSVSLSDSASDSASSRVTIGAFVARPSCFAELVKGTSSHQLYVLQDSASSIPKQPAQVCSFPSSIEENHKLLGSGIISTLEPYRLTLVTVLEERLAEVYQMVAQEQRMDFAEIFYVRLLTFACSRPEDMPCFKGGGMLGSLWYIYILYWASGSIYLNGLLFGYGPGHLAHGYLGLVVKTAI